MVVVVVRPRMVAVVEEEGRRQQTAAASVAARLALVASEARASPLSPACRSVGQRTEKFAREAASTLS